MSATKFHLTPKGQARQCSAKTPDSCKYSQEAGETVEHYDTKEAAQAAYEKQAAGEYASAKTLVKKTSAKKNTYEVPKLIAVEGGGYGGNAWVGSNLEKLRKERGDAHGYVSTKEIAKGIRQELKDATAAGHLPDGLKYSVKTDVYSGGSSIEVRISGFGKTRDTHEYDFSRRRMELKPEYKEIVEKVENIHDSFNNDDSLAIADYFNRGFYGQVKEQRPLDEAFDDMEKARLKFKKVVKENSANVSGTREERERQLLQIDDVSDARRDYLYRTEDYYYENHNENLIYEFTRKNDRNPTDQEFDEMEKESILYAAEQVKKIRKDV